MDDDDNQFLNHLETIFNKTEGNYRVGNTPGSSHQLESDDNGIRSGIMFFSPFTFLQNATKK